MCIGVGAVFSLAFFVISELTSIPAARATDNYLSMLWLWPFATLFCAVIIGFFAIPIALLYERFAPSTAKADPYVTMASGASAALLVSSAAGMFIDLSADAENPFGISLMLTELVVAAGLSGAFGALIWWRGMKALRND